MLKSHTDYLSMTDTTIGQKIHFFRKRAGKSQMELETEVGASAGSISRIEKGNVNPTKETILKIIEVLGLSGKEAAELLGIDVKRDIANIINAISDLQSPTNTQELLQKTVNTIQQEFNLSSCSIFIVKNHKVFAATLADTWYTKLVRELVGSPYERLNVDLDDPHNLIVKAVREKQVIVSNDFLAIGRPAVPDKILRMVEKLSNFKSCMIVPLIHNESSIGALFFSKEYVSDFSEDKDVLVAFSKLISFILANTLGATDK